MKIGMRGAGLAGIIAALVIGAVPCAAQRAPKPPKPPKPPHAPHSWFNNNDDNDGVSKIDTVVSFSPNGTIELSLIAGSMKLSTWDRNQVRVVASTTGEPSLQFDASNSHVTLEQENSGRNNRDDDNGRATYDVTVPVGSHATLSAVSGSIDASGVRGSLEVSNVSGAVDVRNVGSSLSVESVSGRITAVNVGADARLENVSGRISVTGVGGSASAETVSGAISMAGVKGERVHATTVSGNIDFSGSVAQSGRYEFETHSGRTDLRLSSNANAAISVETFSGSVSNDYPGVVRKKNDDPDDDRTNYNYVVGRGDGRVRIETFSGSVHITQGNP
jgi:DUF4097 and DUF4098 domain-containing protein YvlB